MIQTFPKDVLVIQSTPWDGLVIQTFPRDALVIQSSPWNILVIQTFPWDVLLFQTFPRHVLVIQTFPQSPEGSFSLYKISHLWQEYQMKVLRNLFVLSLLDGACSYF